MDGVSKEKNLSEDRYDEKLFKRAYKAGLEAKELEKRIANRKKLLKIFLSLICVIGITILFCVFVLFKEEKPEYIESIESNKHTKFYSINDDIIVSSKTSNASVNDISAGSAFVFNSKNGSIIFEKNIDEKRPIASITKLISAMVILDRMDTEDVVDVSLEHIPENLDWNLELKEGDRIKVDYLLKSMLLSSFNNSAFILANAYPEGYDSFINEMNKKAKTLRMNSSKFDNPAGLDSDNNYSTARDVGKLVSAVLNYRYILDVVNKSAIKISWNSGEELINETIYSTNQLYGVNSYVRGLKTGITDMAKQCFVGYFVYENENELITVVLGSEDRFKDTERLEYASRKLLE